MTLLGRITAIAAYSYTEYCGRSVCVSVGHVREPCKNGWTDQDAVWGLLGWATILQGEGAFCTIEKHWEPLQQCVQKQQNRSRWHLGMTYVIPRKYVLDSGQSQRNLFPPQGVTMAMWWFLGILLNHSKAIHMLVEYW